MKKIMILLLTISLSGCKSAEAQRYVNVECKLTIVLEMRQTLEGYERFDSMDLMIMVADEYQTPYILSVVDDSQLIEGQKYLFELKHYFNLDSQLLEFDDTFQLMRKVMLDGTVEKFELTDSSSDIEDSFFHCDVNN